MQLIWEGLTHPHTFVNRTSRTLMMKKKGVLIKYYYPLHAEQMKTTIRLTSCRYS
jgi:hypothetical protein